MISVVRNGNIRKSIELIGLSTDSKPLTGIANGNKFYEMDTGKTFYFNEEAWGWVDNTATNNLTGIAVTTPPTTVNYVEGDHFNPEGIVITATYGIGSKATSHVVTNRCTIVANDPLTVNDTCVYIAFADKGIKKVIEQAIKVTTE